MPSISSTGIGSGLDVNSIVSQLTALERRPLNLLQQAKTGLDTKLSAVGALQGRMASLFDASKALANDSLWDQTVAKSSNTAAVTASATSDAPEGRYQVKVDNLASGQTVVSRPMPAGTVRVNEGWLTIELGTWAGTPAGNNFTPKAGTAAIQINMPQKERSFEEFVNLINSANAGVNAKLITDASGTRVAFQSAETGAENGFRITSFDANGLNGSDVLLSRFDYPPNDPSGMTQTQTAANAQITINGIPIQSQTNTFDSTLLSGVADGLTLNASRVTTEDVEVNVGQDRERIKKRIESFVDAFNDVAGFIREQTSYDPAAKRGGALQGDAMVNSLQERLRTIVGRVWGDGTGQAYAVYKSLSEIGISFTGTGSLSINDDKLTEYMGKSMDDMKTLLARDRGREGRFGVAGTLNRFLEPLLAGGGGFEARTESLKTQITRNQRTQEAFDRRVSETEARLRRQYQGLDTLMANFGGQSDYLMQQFSLLSGNSNRR